MIQILRIKYLIYVFAIFGLIIFFTNFYESSYRFGEVEVVKLITVTDSKISKIVDEVIITSELELVEANINRVRKEDRDLREVIGLNSEYSIVQIHDQFLINSFRIMEQKARMIKMGKIDSKEFKKNINEYKKSYEELLKQ